MTKRISKIMAGEIVKNIVSRMSLNSVPESQKQLPFTRMAKGRVRQFHNSKLVWVSTSLFGKEYECNNDKLFAEKLAEILARDLQNLQQRKDVGQFVTKAIEETDFICTEQEAEEEIREESKKAARRAIEKARVCRILKLVRKSKDGDIEAVLSSAKEKDYPAALRFCDTVSKKGTPETLLKFTRLKEMSHSEMAGWVSKITSDELYPISHAPSIAA